MSEGPTHFPAEFVTWKHLKTRGTIILQFEIPVEAFDLARRIIGDPPKAGESKYVAIARLNMGDQ